MQQSAWSMEVVADSITTLESLTDDTENVENLIRWWISQSDYRYHTVRKRGTIEDFINDVWVRLIEAFREGKRVELRLSTIVCNTAQWELVSQKHLGYPKTRAARYRMRFARKVKSYDRVESGEYVIDCAEKKMLEHAIARVLRSLTWRQAVIVRAQYGLFGDTPQNLGQIGAVLQISRERVRQIGQDAMKKIQLHERAAVLVQFVDDTRLRQIGQSDRKRLSKTVYGRALLEELTKDEGDSEQND